jgi:hypothetical protein
VRGVELVSTIRPLILPASEVLLQFFDEMQAESCPDSRRGGLVEKANPTAEMGSLKHLGGGAWSWEWRRFALNSSELHQSMSVPLSGRRGTRWIWRLDSTLLEIAEGIPTCRANFHSMMRQLVPIAGGFVQFVRLRPRRRKLQDAKILGFVTSLSRQPPPLPIPETHLASPASKSVRH